MMESNLSSIKGELQISQLKSAAQAAQSLNTTMRQGYVTLGSGSSELQQLSQPRANAPSSSAERRRIHSARETKQGGKSNDMGDHPKQESNRGIDAYQRNYLERQRVISERGSNDQITSFVTDLQEPRILKSPLSNSGQENVAQAFIMSDDKIANKLHQMRTDYDKIKNEIQQTLVQAHTLTSEERRNSRRKSYLDTSIPSNGGCKVNLNDTGKSREAMREIQSPDYEHTHAQQYSDRRKRTPSNGGNNSLGTLSKENYRSKDSGLNSRKHRNQASSKHLNGKDSTVVIESKTGGAGSHIRMSSNFSTQDLRKQKDTSQFELGDLQSSSIRGFGPLMEAGSISQVFQNNPQTSSKFFPFYEERHAFVDSNYTFRPNQSNLVPESANMQTRGANYK